MEGVVTRMALGSVTLAAAIALTILALAVQYSEN
jgi:hypothetical protein